MRTVRPEEFDAVIRSPVASRVKYLFNMASDQAELWGLRDEDGWRMYADDQGNECFPVWPHPDYAKVCAVDSWATARPARISTTDWMDRWTPGLRRDSRRVAVFPVAPDRGLVMSPDEFAGVLAEKLDEVE